jgi:hypothetical protein
MLEGGDATGGYKLGVSGRAGMTFTNGVSLAFGFTYHPAAALPFYADTDPPTFAHYAATVLYLGPEVGYDIRLGRFVIRPYLAVAAGSILPADSNSASWGPATWIGVAAAWTVPRTPLFLGIDLRAQGMASGSLETLFTGSLGGFGVIGVWLGGHSVASSRR